MTTSPPDRLFALDLLRGVAIALVVAFHSPGGEAIRVGWVGVDLFFVLSGFLISGLLFKELDRTGTIVAWRFWLRRGFKIWPAYFAAFGAAFATAYAVQSSLWEGGERGAGDARRYWPNFVFIQNYFPPLSSTLGS